jgi:8-oxo-dGTP pyrophosphatase MutT (NUDIX family)
MRTIKRDIVGAFIFSSDGKILLGKGGVYNGHWLVPGGGVDIGETKLDALKREILEETGIDISTAKIEPLKDVLTGQSEKVLRGTTEKVKVGMKFYNFSVRLTQAAEDIILTAEDDFTDAAWFPVAELSKLDLAPPSVVILKKLGYL